MRLVVGLFAIAALVGAYRWYQNYSADPGRFGSADTAGKIAALEILDDSVRAVILDEKGAKQDLPDPKPGATDKDLAWRPDGNQLFFSSDREGGAFGIYRYNFSQAKLERRSFGSRSQGNIAFGPIGYPGIGDEALITAGGFVLTYKPIDGSTRQILPPVTGERAGTEEGGAGGQFAAIYERFGESFKEARWGPNRESILAVMRRPEGGEVLVLQSLKVVADEKTGVNRIEPPVAVAAGERIEFDLAPDGKAVVCILGFRFPDPQNVPKEFVKNGRVVAPYRHALIAFEPANPSAGLKGLVASSGDDVAFASPRISPDGSSVAAVKGRLDESGQFAPEALVLIRTDGSDNLQLVAGDVREPSWHPSGDKIVFVKDRAIHVVGKDGSALTKITTEGRFASPLFSPQSR